MNLKNLIAIYQFAIARCIDVIGFDNDITRKDDGTHEEVWDIISSVDGVLTIDNGNVNVVDLMELTDEQREIIRRFQCLLCEMDKLDKHIADIKNEKVKKEVD